MPPRYSSAVFADPQNTNTFVKREDDCLCLMIVVDVWNFVRVRGEHQAYGRGMKYYSRTFNSGGGNCYTF